MARTKPAHSHLPPRSAYNGTRVTAKELTAATVIPVPHVQAVTGHATVPKPQRIHSTGGIKPTRQDMTSNDTGAQTS